VVLSAQSLSGEKLKKALATEKEGGFGDFPQPFLKLVFNNNVTAFTTSSLICKFSWGRYNR